MKYIVAQLSRRISEGYKFTKGQEVNKGGFTINNHKVIPNQRKYILSVEEIVPSESKVCRYKKLKYAFKYPCDSYLLCLYIARDTNERSVISKGDVNKKCVVFPFKNGYMILPKV